MTDEVQRKLTTLGTYLVVGLIAGLAGGAISRLLPGANVIRAERIELIDKSGNPRAVFGVRYDPGVLSGYAELSMTYTDGRRMMIDPDSIRMWKDKDFLDLAPSLVTIGDKDDHTVLTKEVITIQAPEGTTSMSGNRILVLNKNGPSAVIPVGP